MRRPWTIALFVSIFCAAGLAAPEATAQIKSPGAHAKYAVDLEPHLLLQWADEPGPIGDEGIGLGLRATIPFLDNGPIRKINNNMGIGFGLDWAHFDDPCFYYGPFDPRYRRDFDCSADDFWLPIVVQWNFFLTPVVVVFGEPGLAIEHTRFHFEYWCARQVNNGVCDFDDSDTNLEPILFVGARFMVADAVGITVRLGYPYISAGVSILL